MSLPIEKSEFQEFVEEGMAEASDGDNMGVVFVVSGKKLLGVPSPLTVETEVANGSAQRKKLAWAIMVPLPARIEDFPKGLQMTDARGRAFKVFRCSEKRMCLEVFVIDLNQ